MTVQIILKYNDGLDHGKDVIISEIWEGNIIPLGKIYEFLKNINDPSLNHVFKKVKTIREVVEY